MSVTTTTTSFRDLSRRTAIDTLYVLEEQRDRALAKLNEVRFLVNDYAPTIKRQLECDDRPGNCGCTFCDFVEDLSRTLN